MSTLQLELSDFHRFAQEKLLQGNGESLQQLLDEWNAAREYERSVAAIGESIQQYQAGDVLPLAEAFAEIRAKLGWTK